MSHPEGRDGERLSFVPGYHVWYFHGENEVARSIDQDERIHNWDHTMNNLLVNVGAIDDPTPTTSYHRMVHEAAGPVFVPDDMKELPNPDAQSFYDMLDSANQEVWPNCETHSKLSDYVNEMLPPDNVMPKNFYETKKLMRGMNMPVERIHTCVNA
ncbi:hypothetical protein KY285_024010 [Solanum tuberosum]|nr:hypothetical protein KY289_025799 [Solanum tuberosum]KAH0676209.1 hypothetical protein KY285_024010 [Solanum tuberosum]